MVFFKFNGLILVELLNIQIFFSSFNKMETKYHTVGTILKSNNNILPHEYMTAHFPGLRYPLQEKVMVLN